VRNRQTVVEDQKAAVHIVTQNQEALLFEVLTDSGQNRLGNSGHSDTVKQEKVQHEVQIDC
jgi:hypothetical protein